MIVVCSKLVNVVLKGKDYDGVSCRVWYLELYGISNGIFYCNIDDQFTTCIVIEKGIERDGAIFCPLCFPIDTKRHE